MRWFNWLFWWRSVTTPAGPTPPAPADRLFSVLFDSRAFALAAEDRLFTVDAESRRFTVA